MMKKIFFLISALFIIGVASAQSDYIVHTIKDGETLTQLANKYGTTVGDIMRLNKMNTDSKLNIGDEVKIPKAEDGSNTHVVGEGETLFSIGKKFHISVSKLKELNGLKNNNIHEGEILKIGSASNDDETSNTIASTDNTPTTTESTRSNTNDSSNQTAATNHPTTDNNVSEKQRTDDNAQNGISVSSTPVISDEGAFAPIYQTTSGGSEITSKGSAAIFKTASGWQDKKYYILMNDIAPGAIAKVQANGKTIYAKVLWNLGNVKENDGLSFRISDAAANVLNLNGDKFDIVVSYYKPN